MNVLVVGGAGYVGGAITDILSKTRHKFRVYDALLYEESYRKPIDFVYGDIRDHQRLLPHLKWADAVVWLAALVGDGACALNPEISELINEKSLGWLAKNFDKRIIFTSTCSVYGAQDGELDENAPIAPLSVYGETKARAEKYLKDKNALIVRFGTLFGVGDLYSRIRLDLIVNTLTVRAHQHGKITIFGGDQFRPLLHVRDAAQTIVDNLGTKVRGVFNLNKQNVRIIDLAYQVRNHFPDVRVEKEDVKVQDTRNYRVTAKKAQDELGFKPSHSIDFGIEQIKEIVVNNRLMDIDNPRYTNQMYLSMFNTHCAGDKQIKTSTIKGKK